MPSWPMPMLSLRGMRIASIQSSDGHSPHADGCRLEPDHSYVLNALLHDLAEIIKVSVTGVA